MMHNDVDLVETPTAQFARLKSSSSFGKMNKLDRDFSYRQNLSPVYPLKYQARAKMASIVNKVSV